MGLEPQRDRLCVVQLSPGDGSADVVQIGREIGPAPNLKRAARPIRPSSRSSISPASISAMLYKWLGVMPQPVYCTKIASRLTRTYTDKHGLKDLTKELLGKDISKQQQSSDWGAEQLTEAQVAYAADDVLNLHALKDKLDAMLAREGRDGARRRLLRVPARPAPGSTSPAGPPRTSSPIPEPIPRTIVPPSTGPHSQAIFLARGAVRSAACGADSWNSERRTA